MNDLRAWALRARDVGVDWSDVEEGLLAFVVDEATYLRVSFSMHFSRAHSRLARVVEEVIAEHARDDRALLRRWAGGKP